MDLKKERVKMKRGLLYRLKQVPHLFSKVVVLYCVAVASGTSLWAMRILSRTGHDPSGLLAVILGFFGGELLLLCLKTVVRPEVGSEGKEREENRDD